MLVLHTPAKSHNQIIASSLDLQMKIQATAILLEYTVQCNRISELLQQTWHQQQKKQRSAWVKSRLTRHRNQGHNDNNMKEIREEDLLTYKNFLHLDEAIHDV